MERRPKWARAGRDEGPGGHCGASRWHLGASWQRSFLEHRELPRKSWLDLVPKFTLALREKSFQVVIPLRGAR